MKELLESREMLDVPEVGTEIQAADSLPPIVDAAEFLASKVELPRELVCGLLHQGSKMVLGGGSKTFKTWTLLDLTVAVAAGEPWLSFKTVRGRVLFLNFEIQPGFLQQRLRAVAKEKGVALAKGQIDLWNLRGHAASYNLLLPRISEHVKELGYVLIVLDPVYKLYGNTDENSAGAVAQLLNAIESLAVDTGAAVAFGAHYSKGNQAGKEAIDRISGSGVFARDPDSILNFTRHEEKDAFTVEATFRNFKPVEPFVVRWQYPLMRRDESLDPTRLKKPAGRKPDYDPADLLRALPDGGLSLKDWQSAAHDQCGVSGTTFHRLRRLLVEQGKVLKSGATSKWQPIKPKQ
jgi:RecA-family ATPase